MILKNCRYVLTQNKNREILENVDVKVEGSKIVEIGKGLGDSEFSDGQTNTQIIECFQKIVMPGLINTHCHNSMQLLKGICDDKELHEWLQTIKPLETKMTNEDLKKGSHLAIKEMIASGTTTFVESYEPILPIMEVTKKTGMRAVFMPHFKEAKELVDKDHGKLITLGVSASSIYKSPKEKLEEIKQFAKKHNILKYMHIAETRKERFDCMKEQGCLPIEYLDKLGWLDDNTFLAHAVWITKGEIKILARQKVSIVHNPVSNMKLASGGVMPLPEMFQEGVNISLGTDSAVSNNNLDLFEELKLTGLLHKHHRWDPTTAPVQNILDMATINGATLLHQEDKIGSLEVGKEADIITIDLTHPKMQPTSKDNLLSNIVYCANGNDVVDTIVAGKVLMKDKIIQ